MKRLRIIIGVDPRQGGPAEGIRQQAAFHAAAGVEEHLVTLDPPDADWLKAIPLKLIALGAPAAQTQTGGWPARWQNLVAFLRLVKWLRTHVADYDHVIVHGLWNLGTLGARLGLGGARVPYVVFTHGMLDPWFKQGRPLNVAAKRLSWLVNEGPLLNNAAYVLFTSEEEKLRARGAFRPYRVRERVVSYGTSDPPDDPATQTQAFRALTPQLARPYLLFLSRIHSKKGCDLLIKAFAHVLNQRDDIDLVIAGPANAEMKSMLLAMAEAQGVTDRIYWPGMLVGPAKWGAFRNAEAFILPSHQENFGIVVAEAMASAKPVLITNKVNIWREVLACGGGLVDDDTQQGIERLISDFINLSPDQRKAMGCCARQGFLDNFEVSGAAHSINKACRDASAFFPCRHKLGERATT